MAGIDLDGAGIDMFPDLTDSVMRSIGQAGDSLHRTWRDHVGVIAGLDSQLGNGPLGRNMAAQYNPAVDQIVAAMDTNVDRVRQRADGGHRAVTMYVEADQASAQSFPQ